MNETNYSIGWQKIGGGILVVAVTLGIFHHLTAVSPGLILKPEPIYDFIIVGAGTAGCVLGSRLSENPAFKVLVVEAGGEAPWITNIPLAAPLFQKSNKDWQYQTEPLKDAGIALNDRVSFWPRGKLLGGSGQINFNIHMFGGPRDYDLWERDYGAKGWNYDKIKKYINKAECLRKKPKQLKTVKKEQCGIKKEDKDACQGNNEQLYREKDFVQCYEPNIRNSIEDSELTNAFLDAGKHLGLPVGSLNDGNLDYGVMATETSIYRGKRWGSLQGYLLPALGRPNLHVLINSQVTKIIWDKKRAIGVEFYRFGNHNYNSSVYARLEVILSTGTINTPILLVNSGIGPLKTLQDLKIQEISALEGVGSNLQDHLNLPIYVNLQKPISLNSGKLATIPNIWNYFTNGKGDLSRSAIEGVAISPVNSENPEIGILLFSMGAVNKDLYASISNIQPEFFDTMFPGMTNDSSEGFILLASCLHPRSRGKIIVKNGLNNDYLSIQPNYLQHPYDLPCMRDAFRFAVRLVNTPSFEALGASIQLPDHKNCMRSDDYKKSEYQEYINCIVKTSSLTAYHPIGTSRMGSTNDPLTVVDSRLKVIGVTDLRVVDASVMPTLTSGSPNSVIIVIAEKASDMIKNDWANKTALKDRRICSGINCEEKLLSLLQSGSPTIDKSKFVTLISICLLFIYV